MKNTVEKTPSGEAAQQEAAPVIDDVLKNVEPRTQMTETNGPTKIPRPKLTSSPAGPTADSSRSRGRTDATDASRSRGRSKSPLLIRKEAAFAAAQIDKGCGIKGENLTPSRSRSTDRLEAPRPQEENLEINKSGSHGSLTKMLGDTVYYFSPRASKKVEREPLSARSKDQLMVFEDGSEALTGDWMKDKAAFTAAQRRLEQNIRTRKLKAKANDYDKSRRDTRKSAECISEVCTMHLN